MRLSSAAVVSINGRRLREPTIRIILCDRPLQECDMDANQILVLGASVLAAFSGGSAMD
jgi:hypothetical protein